MGYLLKALSTELKDLNTDDLLEVTERMNDGEADITVEGVRIIHQDEIDTVMAAEIGGDNYAMGCFNSWFLSDLLELPLEVIEALQLGGSHEVIGQMIVDKDLIDELVSEYVQYDGYGHHFNGYNGSELEVGKYYVFIGE